MDSYDAAIVLTHSNIGGWAVPVIELAGSERPPLRLLIDGYQPLDVENFIKPVIDAVSAGLFMDQQTRPSDVRHWNFDDSNFNTLLIHRLPDADSPSDEGIAVCISSFER